MVEGWSNARFKLHKTTKSAGPKYGKRMASLSTEGRRTGELDSQDTGYMTRTALSLSSVGCVCPTREAPHQPDVHCKVNIDHPCCKQPPTIFSYCGKPSKSGSIHGRCTAHRSLRWYKLQHFPQHSNGQPVLNGLSTHSRHGRSRCSGGGLLPERRISRCCCQRRSRAITRARAASVDFPGTQPCQGVPCEDQRSPCADNNETDGREGQRRVGHRRRHLT